MASGASAICPFCGQLHATDGDDGSPDLDRPGLERMAVSSWYCASEAASLDGDHSFQVTPGVPGVGDGPPFAEDLPVSPGPVEIAAPSPNSVSSSGDPMIDGLLQGSKWALDASRSLTFAFYPNFLQLIDYTEFGKDKIRAALLLWESVANINFVEVAPIGTFENNPTAISFWILNGYGILPAGIVAMAGFPDPIVNNQNLNQILAPFGLNESIYPTVEGDVFFNSATAGSFALGGLIFYAALHEIGHALGLKHPHDGGGRSKPTFASLGMQSFDNDQYTVMSYHNGGTLFQGNAQTPMIFDIAAIQYLYGPNMNTRTGDDRYSATDADHLLRATIWDAGGIDTIDGSQVTTPGIIDLRAGEYSKYGPGFENVIGIARGVNLENAIGGTAADSITGNDFPNRIEGGAGNDTITANAGDDTLFGQLGNDVIFGGDGGDVILGNEGNDTIDGGAGSDTITGDLGGTGNDSVAAGVGNDVVLCQVGADTVDGGLGDDTIGVFAGNDNVTGGAGNDVILIAADTSTAAGGEGNDVFGIFGGNSHILSGGPGDDTFFASGGANLTLEGGPGIDILIGGVGTDMFVYQTGFGPVDIIIGFDRGQGDKIRLAPNINGSEIFSGSQALAQTSAVDLPGFGPASAIVLGADAINVVGVTQLQASDFIIG